jgi:hypothetical protein
MKVRLGFVSNSSSSSFVCGVCGAIESGMDCSPSDFEMFECENGHVFCKSHKLGNYSFEELSIGEMKRTILNSGNYSKEEIEEFSDDEISDIFVDDEHCYIVSPTTCPICQMVNIEQDVLLKFTLKKLGLTQKQAEEEVRKEFKSYEELKKQFKKQIELNDLGVPDNWDVPDSLINKGRTS